MNAASGLAGCICGVDGHNAMRHKGLHWTLDNQPTGGWRDQLLGQPTGQLPLQQFASGGGDWVRAAAWTAHKHHVRTQGTCGCSQAGVPRQQQRNPRRLRNM